MRTWPLPSGWAAHTSPSRSKTIESADAAGARTRAATTTAASATVRMTAQGSRSGVRAAREVGALPLPLHPQVRVQLAGDLRRDSRHRLELLSRRVEHRLRGAEVLEQRSLAGRADPGQAVQHALRHRLVAPRAVVGDGEAVGLVAHALEELELRRVVREQDRVG